MVEIDHLSITYTFPPFLSDLILKALDGASGPRQRRYRQAEGAAGWGIKTIRPPMALILAGQGKIGGGIRATIGKSCLGQIVVIPHWGWTMARGRFWWIPRT